MSIIKIRNAARDESSKKPRRTKCSNVIFLEGKKDAIELKLSSSTVLSHMIRNAEIWGQFTRLKKLDLNSNGLKSLPSALEALAPSLEVLFLSENNFEEIPSVIGTLRRLRMISLRGNRLTELSSLNLPSSSLLWLILTNNQISKIDSNVASLKHVRKLMLSHNKITHIPKELGCCESLELVRLANNDINIPLPKEFLTLPKLAWISLAGNPIAYCPLPKEKEILMSSVSFDESKILGKGASGTVYLGKYKGKDVAVKIFKQQSMGISCSDGNPEDEAAINAIIDHPLAISAHGVFLSDEEGSKTHEGMIMPLLENAEALGKSPSFSTVTRDAAPSESAKDMSREQVLSVVWNVVTVLEHVHSDANVVNGDVYLHNVLKCGEGVAKVSDWGASFVYDGNSELATNFEAIEVLAFGRLVQDLFDWHFNTAVPDTTEPDDFLGGTRGEPMGEGPLKELIASMLQPDQAMRPSFRVIKDKLESIDEFKGLRKS
mmetsp:Transcript_38260/g.81667  ORF Transcript_38260/g.81667 Transcript_38260/m.81667 type:complete len:490 (-) Transcript_38260:88-1557(-)|eukprot:CAMPEP_0172556742 /NCGR_PEP_ID=MMETSP1067-20121228/68573_1 /TAXON_ID=265564 ORGANISM="Thalassiosira punctigera, Strain Tpunct2005C2" /NCGR_SAMPLE_ID=MMETSP1067 /ASSEMBLY_ACC=CAM_ASM_000444 /LENGTH=489 /DNA_ID=CAMNT_0013345627 /DNA_START=206 /DNA_END=1675 /DNA_ORIENTATION=+